MYRIKDWTKFQHYKTGRGAPPWIKLYRDLLNDRDWFLLEPEAAKFLISCWLIAAENDGVLPDSETLAFRLRLASKETIKLLNLCNHWIIKDDSSVLADCYQVATPYTETETETEKETEYSPKRVRTQYGEGFDVFWGKYPKDANMSKKEAFTAWKRLSDEDRRLATEGVEGFTAYCRANPDYRPVHAVRYLRHARWEGFLTAHSGNGSSAPQRKHISQMTDEEREAFLKDFWSQQETAQ
jgi:hypothetical protein